MPLDEAAAYCNDRAAHAVQREQRARVVGSVTARRYMDRTETCGPSPARRSRARGTGSTATMSAGRETARSLPGSCGRFGVPSEWPWCDSWAVAMVLGARAFRVGIRRATRCAVSPRAAAIRRSPSSGRPETVPVRFVHRRANLGPDRPGMALRAVPRGCRLATSCPENFWPVARVGAPCLRDRKARAPEFLSGCFGARVFLPLNPPYKEPHHEAKRHAHQTKNTRAVAADRGDRRGRPARSAWSTTSVRFSLPTVAS